jgi:hypothetical protein
MRFIELFGKPAQSAPASVTIEQKQVHLGGGDAGWIHVTFPVGAIEEAKRVAQYLADAKLVKTAPRITLSVVEFQRDYVENTPFIRIHQSAWSGIKAKFNLADPVDSQQPGRPIGPSSK